MNGKGENLIHNRQLEEKERFFLFVFFGGRGEQKGDWFKYNENMKRRARPQTPMFS